MPTQGLTSRAAIVPHWRAGGPLLQFPRAYSLAQLFERCHVRRQRLAVAQFGRAIAALGVEEVQERSRSMLVGKLRYVERLRGFFEITLVIQLDDLLAAPQADIGVLD